MTGLSALLYGSAATISGQAKARTDMRHDLDIDLLISKAVGPLSDLVAVLTRSWILLLFKIAILRSTTMYFAWNVPTGGSW